jgi:hypothetical protein
MGKISFVKIGEKSLPVAYTLSAMADLEEEFKKPVGEILANVGNLSATEVRKLIRAGLHCGEWVQNGTKAKRYEDNELDELFLGTAFYTYKQFIEILIKDSGIQAINEEADREEAKNRKARTEKPNP